MYQHALRRGFRVRRPVRKLSPTQSERRVQGCSSIPIVDVRLVRASSQCHVSEVEHVEPHVRAVLDALSDGDSFMLRPVVAEPRVVHGNGWPHGERALSRLNRHVELREARAAALLHVVEVEVGGEHARAPGRRPRRVLVVVRLVELPLLVPEYLHPFRPIPVNPRQIADAVLDGGDGRVVRTAWTPSPAIDRWKPVPPAARIASASSLVTKSEIVMSQGSVKWTVRRSRYSSSWVMRSNMVPREPGTAAGSTLRSRAHCGLSCRLHMPHVHAQSLPMEGRR
eukprot:3716172-Pleurochrysis_carterae.AAC.4